MTDAVSLGEEFGVRQTSWVVRLIHCCKGWPVVSADALPPFDFEFDSARSKSIIKADNTIAPFTYMYSVMYPGEIDGDAARLQIMDAIRAQLIEWLGNWDQKDAQMRQCIVDISHDKRLKLLTIKVLWPNLGDTPCLQAFDDIDEEPIKMALFGYEVYFRGYGPRPAGNEIAMNVMIDPGVDIMTFKEAFDRRLGPGGDIADIYKYDMFDQGHKSGQWTGKLIFVVTLKDPMNPRNGPRDVVSAAAALPTTIYYEKRSYDIHYQHISKKSTPFKAPISAFSCGMIIAVVIMWAKIANRHWSN